MRIPTKILHHKKFRKLDAFGILQTVSVSSELYGLFSDGDVVFVAYGNGIFTLTVKLSDEGDAKYWPVSRPM